MSRSVLSRLQALIGILYLIYGAIVITVWLMGGPTPPAAIASFLAASVIGAVVWLSRRSGCGCEAAMSARIQELEARLESPQQFVLVPAPRQSEDDPPIGMDPKTLGAIHRVDARLRP